MLICEQWIKEWYQCNASAPLIQDDEHKIYYHLYREPHKNSTHDVKIWEELLDIKSKQLQCRIADQGKSLI